VPTPRPNTLATASLDRVSDHRKNDGWLSAALTRDTTVVHVVVKGQVPTLGNRSATLSVSTAQRLGAADALMLLGVIDDVSHFAADLSAVERRAIDDALHEDAMFMGLRDASALLDADDANLLALATGISTWHGNHQFCGRCGAPTVMRAAGHERHCDACGADHFPRTDAAMIVLVRNRDGDRCVLGRQKIWPPRMFSTLAGFLEPGESLEDTVKREVREEVGLSVDDIRYSSSQPWPFPQSLMLGFHAVATSEELHVHPTELDDAQWFDRDVIAAARAMGRRSDPMIPPPLTIAGRLIDEWLDDQLPA
jgi:NAD+ diphosphatase